MEGIREEVFGSLEMLHLLKASSESHTGCSLNNVFFPRILENFPPLPRQHSAVTYWFYKKLPANRRVTVYTRIALGALKVSYSDVDEEGVTMNCEQTRFFFPEHPLIRNELPSALKNFKV